MSALRSRRSALALAVLAASLPAYAQESPIDNITIIGRTTDVADVPGSAHVLDAEALGFEATEAGCGCGCAGGCPLMEITGRLERFTVPY